MNIPSNIPALARASALRPRAEGALGAGNRQTRRGYVSEGLLQRLVSHDKYSRVARYARMQPPNHCIGNTSRLLIKIGDPPAASKARGIARVMQFLRSSFAGTVQAVPGELTAERIAEEVARSGSAVLIHQGLAQASSAYQTHHALLLLDVVRLFGQHIAIAVDGDDTQRNVAASRAFDVVSHPDGSHSHVWQLSSAQLRDCRAMPALLRLIRLDKVLREADMAWQRAERLVRGPGDPTILHPATLLIDPRDTPHLQMTPCQQRWLKALVQEHGDQIES